MADQKLIDITDLLRREQVKTTSEVITTRHSIQVMGNDIAEGLSPMQKYLLQSKAQGKAGFAPDSEQAMIDAGEYEESQLGNIITQYLGTTAMIPTIIGALQQAMTKIETLETKVAALEAA